MKKISILGLMLIALVAFQGVASAKEVSGKIAGTDPAANTLSLTAGAAQEKVDIKVDAATTYAGAASLADLTVGQEVSVEANEDASGGWTAVSVKVSEPAAPAAVAAEPAAEPAQ